MSAGSMGLSVLILTLDEEVNLPGCLSSVSWCDDVVVLDSLSTDRTEAVARGAGARFVLREFDDYATQRNFGLSEIEYKHPWVLMLDADERVTPELATEARKAAEQADGSVCLFRLRRKDYFMGKWLRRSSGYPTWFGRMARIGHVRVSRAINEEYHTDGDVGILRHHLLHYPFNKGIHHWIDKHNRYSTMEAEMIASRIDRDKVRWSDVFSSDPTVRRKTLKEAVYRSPGRPLWVFCGLYFLRLGFLDGRAGATFSLLRAYYEYMISCKVKELRRRELDLPV